MYHLCTPLERKACARKAENAFLEFRLTWNPYSAARERLLEDDPNRWIAFLIDIKTHSVAATAEGTISEIETLRGSPPIPGPGSLHLLYLACHASIEKMENDTYCSS